MTRARAKPPTSTTAAPTAAARDLGALLEDHRTLVWGLCYRMTGSAADADDLVQETFVRALASPPPRPDEPWRPWLVRVACNLARDHLRRRKRRRYVGPWLPSPVETAEPPSHEPAALAGADAEARYALLESVSYAFLVALEALGPSQRAVLLLRDVFDYSVRETARALAMSEANVKTTHLRARRSMAAYEARRVAPSPALAAETRSAVERLLVAIATRDGAAIEGMLAADARALSDGGGVYYAALRPILGPARVARFLLGLARRRSAEGIRWCTVNGLPALVLRFGDGRPQEATWLVLRADLDADGRIRELHTVIAPGKLTAVARPG